MENPHTDRRIIITKNLLTNGLIDLMRTKSVHEITIKEICEHADVNRTTFYNHYSNIYDLYDDVINDIFEKIRQKQKTAFGSSDFNDIESFPDFFMSVFQFAEENRDLFLVILGKNGCISIGEAFTKYIDTIIPEKNPSVFSRYSIQFVSAGISHILWIWLNEEKRLPAEKIVGTLSMLFKKGVEQAIISGIDI